MKVNLMEERKDGWKDILFTNYYYAYYSISDSTHTHNLEMFIVTWIPMATKEWQVRGEGGKGEDKGRREEEREEWRDEGGEEKERRD